MSFIQNFIQTNWLLILVFFLSGAMLLFPYVQRLASPLKEIGTLGAIQLINSRQRGVARYSRAKEYEGGRLPNAIHIPLGQLGSRIQELAKLTARPIVVYCDRGGRTRPAESALANQGFKEIYHLLGGFAAWKAAGLPVEK
jgi:rhodanese-related sulfurtransferase